MKTVEEAVEDLEAVLMSDYHVTPAWPEWINAVKQLIEAAKEEGSMQRNTGICISSPLLQDS